MIVETATAIAWLKVGAASVAGAAVKEVTKDAYTALKKKVLSVLGAKSEDAVNRLEKDPNDSSATEKLEADIAKLDDVKRSELSAAITALSKAVSGDEAARTAAVEKGHIDFDLDADGNIVLARISGANVFEVKARARKGDITISDVDMGKEPKSGN